jgi:3'(2'), 5'-bisphosphate nucleotidase
LFYAVRGKGAYSQSINSFDITIPTRIYIVANDDRDNFRFAESVESCHGDQIKQNEVARCIGIQTAPIRMDSQVKYGLVANGQAVVYLRFPNPRNETYRENIWDHAAGAIIVEEAGGKVTDMDGKALNFRDNEKMLHNRGVVVSNGTIHEQVIAALKI